MRLRVGIAAVVVVLLAPCVEHALDAAPPATPKVFSMQRPGTDPSREIPESKDPVVVGISWRFPWATIEPAEGRHKWEPIDQALDGARRSGKKVMIRVVAGINTPDWVYGAGAKPFDFSNQDLAHPFAYPKSLRMPIPWDEVYLAKWQRFIQAFGKRYSRHPQLYSIQMTGGGFIGEMNLPKAQAQWHEVGYSDAKLIAAWKRIIETYQQAFPDVPTNLDINEPLGRKISNVLQPVVAYVLSRHPGKVYLQHNGLRADFPRDHIIRRILREAAGKTTIGYQMLGGKAFLDEPTGDRRAAFRHAVEDGASYIEVYASDLRDENARRALDVLTNVRH